ncbi:ATP synthase subunit I [Candidatus Thioglobus sp.]
MEYVAGILIAVINQSLLYWRMQQLERKNIMDPKQIVNLARLSLIERLMLIGILLAIAMQKLDPLSVIVSFFIINLSFSFYQQCQQKP